MYSLLSDRRLVLFRFFFAECVDSSIYARLHRGFSRVTWPRVYHAHTNTHTSPFICNCLCEYKCPWWRLRMRGANLPTMLSQVSRQARGKLAAFFYCEKLSVTSFALIFHEYRVLAATLLTEWVLTTTGCIRGTHVNNNNKSKQYNRSHGCMRIWMYHLTKIQSL